MTHRDRALLDIAHDAPCMLRVPGVCRSGVNPSVPCHSNKQRHGRGGHLKSHDCFAVAGCNECHHWYDFGPAAREEKDAVFEAGLERYWLWLWLQKLIKVVR